MDKNLYRELLDATLTFATGLTPAAIGAAVGMAWDRGLTWGQRFLQLAVGIIVSFFAARMIQGAWLIYAGAEIPPFVLDGIKFTLGMIAFKATPRFITAAVEVVASLPARVRDHFLPSRKDEQ
jgi:hypothetical protein